MEIRHERTFDMEVIMFKLPPFDDPDIVCYEIEDRYIARYQHVTYWISPDKTLEPIVGYPHSGDLMYNGSSVSKETALLENRVKIEY
jgi:hypothetical protein